MKRLLVILLISIVGVSESSSPRGDVNGDCEVNLEDFVIIASEWLTACVQEPIYMTWVTIEDPGVSGFGRFYGNMSKYETTNAQYCQFLNSAAVTVYGSKVYALADSGHLHPYYNLTGLGDSYDGAVNGGAARINWTGSGFTVDNGYENHPVTYVSWYGAESFCDFYGWRLPTEWEWQAVADYIDAESYTYGCGPAIENSIANYLGSLHPHGTTFVGAFGSYGYGMCDMAGNVSEWTGSHYAGSFYYLCGGCWGNDAYSCRVDSRSLGYDILTYNYIGFRACHDIRCFVPNVVGMSQQEAETSIIDAGLSVGTISEEYSGTIASGDVIRQMPEPGGMLSPESAVDIVISLGYIPVPDVAGMSQSEAESLIIDAGLAVGVITGEYSNTIAIGKVISHMPAAGELLAPGGGVDLLVSLGFDPAAPGLTWLYVDDDGSEMRDENGDPISHGGFTGYMSKYETTNAQYCEFLNGAMATGDITIAGGYVIGFTGPFVGIEYYYLQGQGYDVNGATNGGAARINWTGSVFTVDSGFGDHPVTHVSWEGATAFCDYYGWRLPTEWEWQAVADHLGQFNYGCGPTINNSIANYENSTHPEGTTIVGSLIGTYGYGMCDMAGNVWEMTSSYMYYSHVIRGGCWYSKGKYCTVAYRSTTSRYDDPTHGSLGFRVCR